MDCRVLNPFAVCLCLGDEGMEHTHIYVLHVAELVLHKASDCAFIKSSKKKRGDRSEREKFCFEKEKREPCQYCEPEPAIPMQTSCCYIDHVWEEM